MKIFRIYKRVSTFLSGLRDIPLLLPRVILAYGFFTPAMLKWRNVSEIAEWFDSLGIPWPTFSVYLAASAEMAGVILLPLGLATRFISIPLMFTMGVAIVTVHLDNGFNAKENGFEIPLYYFVMLFALLINGAGKYSLDHIISTKIMST